MRIRALVVATALAAGTVAAAAPAQAASSVAVDASWYAYPAGFGGGVYVATGNLDGDPEREVVTGAGPGGGPHVLVWDFTGGTRTVKASFYAYGASFAGGVRVAVGDVDADGVAEIITGAGPGGGPHVRVFHLDGGTTPREMFGFFAYGAGFSGGVTVAAGNVDGDANGNAEIVTGADAGGGPHVRVMRVLGGTQAVELLGFFAYSPTFTGGVNLAAGDVDGNGRADVITGAGPGGGPHVRVLDFTGTDVAELHGFFAYNPSFRGGVYVASGNTDADNRDEIVTGAGPSGGPHVRVLGETAGTITEDVGFLAYGGFSGGVRVAAGSVLPGSGRQVVTAPGFGGGPHIQLFAVLEDPNLAETTVASGLTHPWDVAEMPNGDLLFTQRGSGIYRWDHNTTNVAAVATPADLFVGSETGMMGIELDPGFNGSGNRTFYACQGYTSGGTTDIRVGKWQLSADLTTATKQSEVVTGLPVTSGRHGGCTVRFDPDGAANELYVSAGDAVIGTAPQDLTSLGGKILRVRTDAAPNTAPDTNPFITSIVPATRLVYTYGHRNPQGIAFRPGSDEIYAVEHGSDRDDEVNQVIPGKNYGWNPVPGYNEAVPMTDFSLAPQSSFGVQGAAWSSGYPTIAPSGATFLDDPVWKGWNGGLATAVLKDQHLRVFRFGFDGTVTPQAQAVAHGRLRTPRLSRDGKSLFVTTSNGAGGDIILELTPS